jgi:PAS domain S-box-containing protein
MGELGAMLAGIDGALSFQDTCGRMRFQNFAHAVLFGATAGKFDEACGLGHVFKQKEVVGRLQNAAATGQSWHGEADLVASDGRTVPLEIHALAVRDPQGRPAGAFWLFHDITARRELERRREQEREYEARMQRLDSLGQMAGALAHDFNTSLTLMLGFLSAARTSGVTPAAAATWLDKAEHTGWLARELTQEMLDFARGAEPVKRPLQLSEVVEQAAQLGVQGSKARLKIELGAGIWRTEADPDQIRQVITNVVRNAAQAMTGPAGVIELRLENHAQVTEGSFPAVRANYVCLTIADNGPGIPPDRRAHIFEPFYTTRERGAGLGLAITYNIVKRHGGFVRVQSEPDAGSKFEIFLPALPADAAGAA